MLIKFSVKNFRSFKEEATLELSPGRCRTHPDHIQNDQLKTAAIFGANSSGKSNFIKAIKYFKNIVTDKYFTTKDPIYCLDCPSDKKTSFEIEFQIGNYVYRYRLSVISPNSPSERLSEQAFSYIRTDEELDVANADYILTDGDYGWISVFDPIHITINEKSNISNWAKTISENTILKEKLRSYHTEYDTSTSQLEYRRMRKKMFKLSLKDNQASDDSYNNGVEHDTDKNNIVLKEMNSEIKKLEQRAYVTKKNIKSLSEKLDENNKELEGLSGNHDYYLPFLMTKKNEILKDKDFTNEHLNAAYNWILSSLVVIETDDFHIPLNNMNLTADLSSVIGSFDVGIKDLSWYPLSTLEHNSSVALFKKTLGEKDRKNLENSQKFSNHNSVLVSSVISSKMNLYLFTYWIGAESIYELGVLHEGENNTPFQLCSESDGTRRIIELASIFIPTIEEKVYVVDEIDFRLHPNLTKHIVEDFFNRGYNNKQLIFSTHESRLMTTELFRIDELWTVYREGIGSKIISLEQVKRNPRKRLDVQYLKERTLPGVPNSKYPMSEIH